MQGVGRTGRLSSAALVLVLGACTAGRSIPPTPTMPGVSPSVAGLPTTVDGMAVQSVSGLLASRAAGQAPGGPYALAGYWTNRNFGHSCVPPQGQPGELELYCVDGEWGITQENEAILTIDLRTGQETEPAGPHLTPWVPSEADQQRLFTLPFQNGQFWPPVPIVVVGHFDDPKAAECRPEARQKCLDRFVIDRIVSFDPASVPGPAPSPSPTPFPFADPPPALFTSADCYDGVPKSFIGWTLTSELHIQFEREGYVYAMVTRDVIAIGEWYDHPDYPGHKARWWGQGVCLAQQGVDGVEFASVAGTTFLEIDDGRHIPGQAP